jgi:hypothetical protein
MEKEKASDVTRSKACQRKQALTACFWWLDVENNNINNFLGKTKMKREIILLSITVFALITSLVSAEIVRGINIDFVTIGNAGNAADTQVMTTDGTTGYGSVGYNYRIGKYEVTNAQWVAFIAAAGIPMGNPSNAYDIGTYYGGDQQPTTCVSWYEGLQFCNYLTSGDKSKGVYRFSGNNANPDNLIGIDRAAAQAIYGTVYVLPTENEWYKAAYYKPDGSGYTLYANSGGAVCHGQSEPYLGPWNVGTGAQEQNGTFDMMGNVCEWNENQAHGTGVMRGGGFTGTGEFNVLASTFRGFMGPFEENFSLGFRVASFPIPATLLLHNPNGSEVLVAGSTYPVTWSSTGSIANVLIEYSTNNGQVWNVVSPPNIGNTGSYGWSVPMVDSHDCLIRISDAANSYVSDISNNVFEITIPKTITVISPNGSESLISGADQLIQWSSTGAISDILIEQSFNNGLNWFPVEPANIGNSGSYEWFVPFANSDECLVRISDASNPALYDTSDNVFTISQENPSEYPTLYEILGGSAPAIIESGRDFVTRSIPDANVVAFILLESAGFANENILGIYSAYDPQQKLQLFSGSDSPADMTIVVFDSTAGTARNMQTGQMANIEEFFGFYLTTPQNGGITYYTDLTRNPDLSEHGLIYNTSGFAGVIEGDPDTVIAFEDFLGLGDSDYNDMVVGITNAVPLSGSEPYCIQEIPGDLNGDCKVNLVDFAVIVAHWLECNIDPQEACWQ